MHPVDRVVARVGVGLAVAGLAGGWMLGVALDPGHTGFPSSVRAQQSATTATAPTPDPVSTATPPTAPALTAARRTTSGASSLPAPIPVVAPTSTPAPTSTTPPTSTAPSTTPKPSATTQPPTTTPEVPHG